MIWRTKEGVREETKINCKLCEWSTWIQNLMQLSLAEILNR